MNQSPLHPNEWNFDPDRIPDSELVACCYWEYARESEFIREAVAAFYDHSDTGTDAATELQTVRELNALLFDTPGELPRLFPKPWQELSPEVRADLAESVNYRPEPIHVCTDDYTAKELHKMANYDVSAEAETWKKPKRGKKFEKKFPDPLPVSVRWADGRVSLILDIALERYSVDELSKAFRKWLNMLPRVGSKHHVKRGQSWHKWRVALRRLGIMRLNYHYTKRRLQTACLDAWEKFRDMPDKEWHAAPAHVARLFQDLFTTPYCTSMELDDPIHFRPKRRGKRLIVYRTADGRTKYPH